MVLGLVLIFALTTIMAADSSNEVSKLSVSNDNFTKSFFNIVREEPGNLFFSPISIQTVLGLVHAGAAGNTLKQIQSAAHLPESAQEVAENFGKLVDGGSDSNVILRFANGLYTDTKFSVKPAYLDLVQKGFKAELGQVDFSSSAEAANTINTWVAGKTNDKIRDLFDAGSLNAATKLVLLSAVYFKGNWAKKFPVADTSKGVFHLNEKDKKDVDYMTVKSNFRIAYDEKLNADFVELPYEGETVSMLLCIPREIEGLSQVESQLKDIDLLRVGLSGRKREVIVKLPKFKLEQTLDLKESLVKLGITDLFTDHLANLTGISEKPLVASKAVQKAFIEVNEEGSEAAAATAIKIRLKRSLEESEPLILEADRPFLFLVRSEILTLFLGALRNPEESSIPRHTEL